MQFSVILGVLCCWLVVVIHVQVHAYYILLCSIHLPQWA